MDYQVNGRFKLIMICLLIAVVLIGIGKFMLDSRHHKSNINCVPQEQLNTMGMPAPGFQLPPACQ